MRSAKTRTAALLAALSLIAAAPSAPVDAAAAHHPQAVAAAKKCPPGFVHASLSWGHKCLRAGQYCKKGASANREYHRYGFHCARNGRLRHR